MDRATVFHQKVALFLLRFPETEEVPGAIYEAALELGGGEEEVAGGAAKVLLGEVDVALNVAAPGTPALARELHSLHVGKDNVKSGGCAGGGQRFILDCKVRRLQASGAAVDVGAMRRVLRGTMAGRDDGEFELILGNKQLLSVLFIVIVLLGVFFAMGFLAGRTTGASPAVAQANPQDRQPLAVDSASGRPPMVTDDKPEPAPVRQAEPVAPPPAPAKETKAALAEPVKKSEAAAPAKSTPAKSTKADAGGFIATPPTGTYLQAAATRRVDAEAMLAGIRGKTGFGGFVTPSPKNAELFRVVVGPLVSKTQQAEARVKLAEIGVKNPFLVTY